MLDVMFAAPDECKAGRRGDVIEVLADGVAIRQAQDERPGDTPTEAA